MKSMVIVALIVLSVAASVRGAVAQTTAPTPNQPDTPTLSRPLEANLIWYFPTPVAPRPKQCHPFWYPVQYWGTDASGRTLTWVSYTAYYLCY